MKKPGLKRKPKELSLGERVNLLMEYGTEHPEKWMPVHGYEELDNPWDGTDWKYECQRLREHHLAETKFMMKVIEELRARLQHEYDLQGCAYDD
jgi:hypothetical protein